jgi:hypothetical protein
LPAAFGRIGSVFRRFVSVFRLCKMLMGW